MLVKDLKKSVKYISHKYVWLKEIFIVLISIIIIFGAVYAYCGVWPPLVVVESSSMQHSSHAYVYGVINAGDMVFVKKVTVPSSIQTYVDGEHTGFKSYGEFGNVIIYHKNDENFTTPIIHRAIVYLIWNRSEGGFDIPSLMNIPYGSSWRSSSGDNYNNITRWLTLYNIGWKNVTVNISLSGLRHHNGYITMGDNNYVNGNGIYDQEGLIDYYGRLVQQVESSWIVGIATGYIPWLGSLKLLVDGNYQYVPYNTWYYLGGIITGIFIITTFIDYGLPVLNKKLKKKIKSK